MLKENFSRRERVAFLMLLPSLIGFFIFYIFPFILSLSYAFVENSISMKFSGFYNFVQLFRNEYFIRGLKNTCFFITVSVPLNIVLSLWLSLVINKMVKFNKYFFLIFLVPLVIPSATTAFFWENIFGLHGSLNKLLSIFGLVGVDWIESKYGMLVMIIIFLWKNVGYNMALFITGLNNIPKEYYECASMEGANKGWIFKKITFTYLMPTLFLVLIMTLVNSFKVFKEIYIITGEYPPDSLYLLQHYMNNMFLSLNYSKLVSAVYILTIIIVLVIICIFKIENKMSEDLRN